MKRKLEKVSCKYGAPMGRRNSIPDDVFIDEALSLRKLKWQDGDYTEDGTYWGGGMGDNVYWANGSTSTSQEINIFVRAKNRQEAKEKVREEMKNAVKVTFCR
jgi:hypothetical protein